MTDADKPDFARAFSGLCLALREKEPDAVQMRTYFKAMDDFDVELVSAAAERIAASAEWFPKAPEWRAAVVKIEQERIALAAGRNSQTADCRRTAAVCRL
jgi:hypothetical protein